MGKFNVKLIPKSLILLLILLVIAGCSGKKEQPKVTFIEFGSDKCPPCIRMRPIMDDIEKSYKDQVKVVFHDVYTLPGGFYYKKFGIRDIPTQVFLDKGGREYYRHIGFFPKEELIKVLKLKGVE